MTTFSTASQYESGAVSACYTVLVELVHVLGDFVDDIAIVGGWVPQLLIRDPKDDDVHVGSMDVDIALNATSIDETAYMTINKLLTRHGYRRSDVGTSDQFKYFKNVTVEGRAYEVEVDLLTGEYVGHTGKRRRHEPIQDIKARKARGADLVFDRTETIVISGDLPEAAGKDTVKCKIAGVIPFIVMKGMALAGRKKEKDAYDLDYVLRHYPGSIDAIAELIAADINHGLIREALSNIEQKFQTIDHWGPTAVADFREAHDAAEHERVRRRAFEAAQALLSKTLHASG